MAHKKQKLELTWIGKESHTRVEPRILLENADMSYHASHLVTNRDIFENKLISGDNLLALKALEQDFLGKVKCVYIDPPFNTGEMFENYDDGVEHSIWLSQMRARLIILHKLLSEDGTLVVHIDDNEIAYLIVLLDEIFGRSNRAYVTTFKQGAATGHKSINPGCVSTTNFLLIYAKNRKKWLPRKLYTARERDNRYNQFITNIKSPYSEWIFKPLMEAFAENLKISIKAARAMSKAEPSKVDKFVLKNAESVVRLARPDYKAVSEKARELIDSSNREPNLVFLLEREYHADMYFVKGERVLFYKNKLKNIDGELVAGEPLTTLWADILSNNLHKEGGVKFPKGKKPEKLLQRVINLTTDTGDIVLDSFLGSGTTAAVAHKMGRRWIGIEVKEHCDTHCVPRLRSVIDGEDQSGITKNVDWKGGGGFRYYKLAPSLIKEDQWGNHIINSDFVPELVAEAVCKIEGFNYAPSEECYWQHGQASETDFVYVTTQNLNRPQLEELSQIVGPNRSLLICCGAFRVKKDSFSNLTLKKIPKAVLSRCEWDHDDYSLRIQNLPDAPNSGRQQELTLD